MNLLRPTLPSNDSSSELVSEAPEGDASPLTASLTIFAVFLISPLSVCSNVMMLTTFRRFQRLQTPSNAFVASLATADLSNGLMLPLVTYLELSQPIAECMTLCLLAYSAMIAVCGMSLLSMAAIALDRCTSLIQPLRYNNIITRQSVSRYIAIFCMYSLLMGSVPILYWQVSPAPIQHCSFRLVNGDVRVFLFCSLYVPCAAIVIFCYGYVYVIARGHANAIYSFEFSQGQQSHVSKYGRTLALTVGSFLACWLPFQVCMVTDVWYGSNLLTGWFKYLLALLIFVDGAANPWIYGYRSSEFRTAFHRVFQEFLMAVGVAKAGGSTTWLAGVSEMPSCGSNVRLCPNSPNTQVADMRYLRPMNNNNNNNYVNHLSENTVICETVFTAEVSINGIN